MSRHGTLAPVSLSPSAWAGHVLQRGVILLTCRSSLAASFVGIGGKRRLKEGGVVCRATPSSVRPVHPSARTGPRKALGGRRLSQPSCQSRWHPLPESYTV